MSATRHLGRYELLEQLGEGGMGAVWLARLTGTGGFEKLCIVKTVLPSIASDKQFVGRFLHEGRILTQLQHSNIAQVFDMGDDAGTLYLALEYVPGVDLSRLVQHAQASGQPLPVPVALFIMQQVAEGLGFGHRKVAPDGQPLHIVHRDVSPQNIMVSYEGEVKVIDFGIAKSEARSQHTAQAQVMGKLGYMAPEQARGEPVDHRADQYACAVVLWELLANTPYVHRGTITEMVVAMAAPPPPKTLLPLRPEVPPILEAEVLKALSPRREERFPTTDDFARALSTVLGQMGGAPSRMQVGEFVRAACAQEYTAQQKLLTRIHTMKAPIALTGGTPPEEAGLAATALRPTATPTPQDTASPQPGSLSPGGNAVSPQGGSLSHGGNAASPQSGSLSHGGNAASPQSGSLSHDGNAASPLGRSLSQGGNAASPSAAPVRPGPAFPNPLDMSAVGPSMAPPTAAPGAPVNSNKTLLIVLIALFAVGGLLAAGGVAWYVLSKKGGLSALGGGSTPVAQRDTPTPGDSTKPTPTSPPEHPTPATPDPVKTPDQPAPDAPPANPPPVVDDGRGTPPPPGALEAVDFAVEVYTRGSAYFVKGGQDLGLKVGQALPLYGPEVDLGHRHRLGSASVVEVLAESARVQPDDAATQATGPLFAAIALDQVPQGTPVPPPNVVGPPPTGTGFGPPPTGPATTASPVAPGSSPLPVVRPTTPPLRPPGTPARPPPSPGRPPPGHAPGRPPPPHR